MSGKWEGFPYAKKLGFYGFPIQEAVSFWDFLILPHSNLEKKFFFETYWEIFKN